MTNSNCGSVPQRLRLVFYRPLVDRVAEIAVLKTVVDLVVASGGRVGGRQGLINSGMSLFCPCNLVLDDQFRLFYLALPQPA